MQALSKAEKKVLMRIKTPAEIQDFLDSIPMNHEKKGETHYSALAALHARKAHCIEGALIAALILKLHGEKPLLMDLRAKAHDYDHVIALYKRSGHWGAISKTNHATIRFRDPVYKTLHELALSYFHEWFMNTTGEKTLVDYSRPLNLNSLSIDWIGSEKPLWELDDVLDTLPHYSVVPKDAQKFIRKADKMELKAGRLIEWPENNPRT